MKMIKKVVLVVSFIIFGGLGSLGNVNAITCPSDSVRSGESVESLAECNVGKSDGKDAGNEVAGLAKDIIGTLIPLAGVIALIVVIMGGYMIAVSAGDAGKIKQGKTTIIWGVGGMVVTFLAYAIISLVINNVF